MAETYRGRDEVLLEMGFACYGDYLNSDLWVSIRTRAYALHGNGCRLCPAKATAVHHVSYVKAVLLGLDLTRLAPLCERCHYKVEFTKKKQKRNMGEAQRVFDSLLKKWARRKCPICEGLRSRKGWCPRCKPRGKR